MRIFLSTVSAAVLGFSSLAFAGSAGADSFSISYSDADYMIYRDYPVYVVHRDWLPYRARHHRHHRHHGKRHWRHAHHRHHHHHKHRGHHRGRHHRHHW